MQPNDGELQPNSKGFIVASKTMFLAKNSHHCSKSTHNEEKKTINFRMLLYASNEKKMLTAQRIQNSVIWYLINFAI